MPSTDETTPGHFALSADDQDVIHVLKLAEQINPKIQVIATPWTAPIWMKSPSSYKGGTLKSTDDTAYAAYFVSFIKAYEADGITIDYVTPQNEPGATNDPSMQMSASNETTFIDNFLSPALSPLPTKILAYDWNWDAQSGACAQASACWPDSAIKNVLKNAPSNVVGIAWHCYSDNNTDHGAPSSQSLFQGSLRGANPLQIMDECSGTGPNYPLAGNLNWDSKDLVIGSLNNFGSGIQFWNLALPKYPYTPPSGSCKSTPAKNEYCRGVITVPSPTSVTFNIEYYILKALAASIEAGSTHIHTLSSDAGVVTSTAASNPDGTRGLYVETSSAVSSVTVVDGDHEFKYAGALPADSVVSFRWSPAKISGAKTVASDGQGNCAVLSAGGVACWGDNTYGELGNGTSGGPDGEYGYDTPQAVTGIAKAVSIASDTDYSYCGVLSTGRVDCWGANSEGELGNGTTGGPDCVYGDAGYCYDTPQPVSGITNAVSLTSDAEGYCRAALDRRGGLLG